MSNKKISFFNPKSLNYNKAKVDAKAKFPDVKKNTTFDPNYKSRFISSMTFNLNKEPRIPINENDEKFKKNGKPLKPNVGSMDRLLKLKAAAFSKENN